MISLADLKKSPVVFDEASHTYHLDGVLLNGVTSTLIHRAFPDKYKEVDAAVLARAAEKGHELHAAIEFHDTFEQPYSSSDHRINLYDKVKIDNGLTTIANEYLVSDEEHYASSIDIVMVNDNNEICLVDTKSTYTLDKASTGLQLSIYKRFFEQMNPSLRVAHIYVLWMPNKDHSICELHELAVVDDETLDKLIEADLADEPFEFELIPDEWADIERQYRYWAEKKAEADEWLQRSKDRMMEVMQRCNLTNVRTDAFTVSYIPAKKSSRFDTVAFKRAEPDKYEAYMKETETAATIRVLPRKQDK